MKDIIAGMEERDLNLPGKSRLPSPLLAIQYLEDTPGLSSLGKEGVITRLREAVRRVPFSHLLVGWNVPQPLLEACRLEAEHLGMRFIRWQPMLVGDRQHQPTPYMQVVSLPGKKVSGYHDLPEFTFVCPNHPAVQEAAVSRIDSLIQQGIYQGLFLDRIRFPSPCADPGGSLACFCDDCRHKAAEIDLDLEQVRSEILHGIREENGSKSFVSALLSREQVPGAMELYPHLAQLLDFREKSIADFLNLVTSRLREAGLEIGLDCFSPCLARMVGQDIGQLGVQADWVKLMTYAHTLAPAGIPFELSGLIHYLAETTDLGETQALELISQSIGLPLPATLQRLEQQGLSTPALVKEVRHGVDTCPSPTLAGIELVDLAGVVNLTSRQIRSDLAGLRRVSSAGLAVSWDLLHIPLENLDLVRQFYIGSQPSP